VTSCHLKPTRGSSSLVPYGGRGPHHSFILCGRQDIREGLERSKDPNSVRLDKKKYRNGLTTIHSPSAYSRSQQSEGHKTKWQERMNKTQKELAVKKLQQELRQEKEDERRR